MEEGEARTILLGQGSISVPEAFGQEGICGGKRLQAISVAIQGKIE